MPLVSPLFTDTSTLLQWFHTPTMAHMGGWGYIVVLIATMGESIPFIGMPIPGQMIVLAAAFLSKTGTLHPLLVFLCAAIGAIGGDWIGYSIGKHYGYDVARRYARYVFLSHSDIDRLATMIRTHAGKSLILGRFNSFTRAFAPFAAGVSRVPRRVFLLYNIVGGVLWAGAYVTIGYIFGHGYTIIAHTIHKYVFWGLVALVVLAVVWKTYRMHTSRTQPPTP